MAKFHLAANALIEKEGKYLMIQEGKDYVRGTWNVPGGGIEHGEDPVEAVRREIREETGLETTEINGLKGVFSANTAEDGHPVKVFVFECEVENKDPEPRVKDEILNAKFLSTEEIKNKELRNDIVLRTIEFSESNYLSTDNFQDYLHPYLDEEP